MSRDHYKGIPKRRTALLNSDGDLEALQKGGDPNRISGTTTMTGGFVTVSGSHFTSDSYLVATGKFPYPTTDSLSWNVGDGYITISGSAAGTYTVAYAVIMP